MQILNTSRVTKKLYKIKTIIHISIRNVSELEKFIGYCYKQTSLAVAKHANQKISHGAFIHSFEKISFVRNFTSHPLVYCCSYTEYQKHFLSFPTLRVENPKPPIKIKYFTPFQILLQNTNEDFQKHTQINWNCSSESVNKVSYQMFPDVEDQERRKNLALFWMIRDQFAAFHRVQEQLILMRGQEYTAWSEKSLSLMELWTTVSSKEQVIVSWMNFYHEQCSYIKKCQEFQNYVKKLKNDLIKETNSQNNEERIKSVNDQLAGYEKKINNLKTKIKPEFYDLLAKSEEEFIENKPEETKVQNIESKEESEQIDTFGPKTSNFSQNETLDSVLGNNIRYERNFYKEIIELFKNEIKTLKIKINGIQDKISTIDNLGKKFELKNEKKTIKKEIEFLESICRNERLSSTQYFDKTTQDGILDKIKNSDYESKIKNIFNELNGIVEKCETVCLKGEFSKLPLWNDTFTSNYEDALDSTKEWYNGDISNFKNLEELKAGFRNSGQNTLIHLLTTMKSLFEDSCFSFFIKKFSDTKAVDFYKEIDHIVETLHNPKSSKEELDKIDNRLKIFEIGNGGYMIDLKEYQQDPMNKSKNYAEISDKGEEGDGDDESVL